MKIIHTSDWHLGHTIYGHDRTEEQDSMLEQMRALVSELQPDLFLLSGDVFHVAQPSSYVQTVFTEALVTLHEACPDMYIVITAGNHDSPSRHEVFKRPWKELNVFMTGSVSKEAPQNNIIEIPGKGYVAAVPYCSDRNLPEGFYQMLLDLVAERNTAGLPVIMTAHTTVSGCDTSGHEMASLLSVGGIDGLDISELGVGYDYLALGHIHKPQYIAGSNGRARYCGTPLPVSFDESYAHSVSVVEISAHGEKPQVTTVTIDNPWPVVTLPSEGYLPWDETKNLLAAFPDELKAYVRLNVEVEDFLPAESYAEAAMIAKDKSCRFCCINVRRNALVKAREKELSISEFKEKSPVCIAERYAEDNGTSFDEELHMIFDEVLKIIDNESREG